MTAYTTEQYRFIVEQLAEGETASAIAFTFARRWKDTSCKESDVRDAERPNLTPEWQQHFDNHRAKFIADAPAKTKEFRIAMLDKMAREAAGSGKYELAGKLVELIDKLDSGFFKGKAVAVDAGMSPDVKEITVKRTIVYPDDRGS